MSETDWRATEMIEKASTVCDCGRNEWRDLHFVSCSMNEYSTEMRKREVALR